MNWVFVKHGTTIFHGNTRMVNDPRYSVILPVGRVFLDYFFFFLTQLCYAYNRVGNLHPVESVRLPIILGASASHNVVINIHHHHHYLSLNHEGRWGTTDDFTTSFLHFSLFSTALWDLANSRPFQSLMLSSHLFLCLPCLLPPFTVTCKMVLARPDEQET